jgi:hypothetical protein
MVTVPESPAISVPGDITALLATVSDGLVEAAYDGTDNVMRSTTRMLNSLTYFTMFSPL